MSLKNITERIRELQEELETEFAKRYDAMAFRVEKRRVIFEEEVARQHKELKIRLWAYIKGARPLVILTAPFIYAVIIPFVILDLFVSVYQVICFPVYGITKARRSDYITFDRSKLAYLNGIEKFNCMYCSYGNGLIAYAREIASRTEQYWRPIKHAKRMLGRHDYYPEFLDYGDAEAYHAELKNLRARLAALEK